MSRHGRTRLAVRLRNDIAAYTGTPPTEEEVALAAITPPWGDLTDDTDWDALYGDEPG